MEVVPLTKVWFYVSGLNGQLPSAAVSCHQKSVMIYQRECFGFRKSIEDLSAATLLESRYQKTNAIAGYWY